MTRLRPAGEDEALGVAFAHQRKKNEGAEERGGREPGRQVGSKLGIGGPVNQDVLSASEADAENGAFFGGDARSGAKAGNMIAAAVREVECGGVGRTGEEEAIGGVEAAAKAVDCQIKQAI